MMAAGPLARRSEALRRISLSARTAFGLAVVFLMIAKPDGVVSLVVLGLALAVSMLVAAPIALRQPTGLSQPMREVVKATRANDPPERDPSGSKWSDRPRRPKAN